MQRGWYLVGIQLLIIVQAVDGRHGTVVMSQGNEGAWRMMADVLLVAVVVHQLTLRLLAQQVVARTLMRHALLHRDDRVEQYLEVRHGVACGVRSNGRGQMTTC